MKTYNPEFQHVTGVFDCPLAIDCFSMGRTSGLGRARGIIMRRFVNLATCALLAACNKPAESSASADHLAGQVDTVDYTTLISEKADEASAAIDAADNAQQINSRVGAVDGRLDENEKQLRALESRVTALESRAKP